MGVVASVASTFSFPLFAGRFYLAEMFWTFTVEFLLSQGGHVGLVWGWLIPCPFVLCIAACLAELTSAMPYVTSLLSLS